MGVSITKSVCYRNVERSDGGGPLRMVPKASECPEASKAMREPSGAPAPPLKHSSAAILSLLQLQGSSSLHHSQVRHLVSYISSLNLLKSRNSSKSIGNDDLVN